MATTPQDHKSELFSFDVDGKTYTFEKSLAKVRSFGWQRKHRHLSDEDKMFLVFEECAGDDALEALDGLDMASEEFQQLAKQLGEHMGGEGSSLPESAAS